MGKTEANRSLQKGFEASQEFDEMHRELSYLKTLNPEELMNFMKEIQPKLFRTFITGEEYPLLAELWDNDDDAIFDTL